MITLEIAIKEYFDENKSLKEIATSYNTYPNKIKRMLVKAGYELRDKSEAQALALESGRTVHPTMGKKMSAESRIKVSEKNSAAWAALSDKEREKRKKKIKEIWDKKPKKHKEEMVRKAHNAVRETSEKGSKLELAIRDHLLQNGYAVLYHHRGLCTNVKLETDIYLPKLKLAIEVNGPSHFMPIWGDESLARQQKADMEKLGSLMGSRVKVLRVNMYRRNMTQKCMRDILNKVLSWIKANEANVPDVSDIDIQ